MVQAYEGKDEDKRLFKFEEAGDYVQLKSEEYPSKNDKYSLAQGYEGEFINDKRLFDFEQPGDFWIKKWKRQAIDLDSHLQEY